MLKKFPSNRMNGSKNAFLTHHRFTFNLQFLCELNHKVRLYKTDCGIFYFLFHFIFIKVYIFIWQNTWTL